MDDFPLDRIELNGALISMEFGPGGRITQLWASDPNLPEEGEEFQFVLPPLNFGEEFSEDYYPGTILLSVRTGPKDPWVSSRSTGPEEVGEESQFDAPAINFDYEFPLLPEIRCHGKYHELPGPIPRIAWDVTIRNSGRQSIEVGELAFPFALNNLYEGFGRGSKPGGKSIWLDRVYIHKYVGGAASYLFAQRLNAEPPGLLIFPGEETQWEFFTHARASLTTPYRWAGVPVMYVYSRAAMEREGWEPWDNEHTSLILEPGDQRTFQTIFVPTERDRYDFVHQTLAACGRPAIKVLPGAVAPADVGIAMEIGGATPARFFATTDVDFETDADEDGGFCFLKPKHPGEVRLSFEDTLGRVSHAHLKFIEPIETLIKKRADWILKHQFNDAPTSALHHAFLVANVKTGVSMTGEEEFGSSFAVEGGLADALFLAEKNTIYPDKEQVKALDATIADFIRDDLQNPSDDTVGSAFMDAHSVAFNYGRPQIYPLVYSLYHSMARVASIYGETRLEAKEYLKLAAGTAFAMFRYGIHRAQRNVGLLGNARLYELIDDLNQAGMQEEVARLMPFLSVRNEDLTSREFPYAGDNVWDTAGFEEAFAAARYLMDDDHQERAMRCAYAARSLAPSWWWYGSDIRQWDPSEGIPHAAFADNGEICLGYTTSGNSMMFFNTLDHDYGHIHEAHMRLAFGGMLGAWALVQPDGAASMGYCPDLASSMHGHTPLTGDIGNALYHYLRGAGAYVMPSRTYGVFTFGCHFEIDDQGYTVRPWDGVGRQVVLRQIGAEFTVRCGQIEELRLDPRKRWAEVSLLNPADKPINIVLNVKGLWGKKFQVNGRTVEAQDGILAVSIRLNAHARSKATIKVIE